MARNKLTRERYPRPEAVTKKFDPEHVKAMWLRDDLTRIDMPSMPFSNALEPVQILAAAKDGWDSAYRLVHLSSILDAIDQWERLTFWVVHTPPPSELDTTKIGGRYKEVCVFLAYALGEYVEGADICALQQCSDRARIRLDGGPKLTQDEWFSFLMTYNGIRGSLTRLKSAVMSEIGDFDSEQARWEKKLDEWSGFVEFGYVAILRRATAAIKKARSPQTQEQLARHFGNDTSSIKRPLASARKFGLLDHFKKPKGFWPSCLVPHHSWVRTKGKRVTTD
jgi:hypothetical protein